MRQYRSRTIGGRLRLRNSSIQKRVGVVVTDALEQVQQYMMESDYFPSENQIEKMQCLSKIMAQPILRRTNSKQITVFCSTGLGGTEVVLANAVLK